MRGTVLAALLCVPAAAAPVDASRCDAMKAHFVLHDGAPVGCERLVAVHFSFIDFAGRRHDDGEVVVLDAVAPAVERIFAALYAQRFPIAKARPMEAYDGDDAAAMADDNTSAFNHRVVADSPRLSLHAYGVAIDINPAENPYLTRRGTTLTVAPSQAAAFINRREDRPGKAARAGLAERVVAIFAENGFINWGGNWDDPIDYQHFDIGRDVAMKLAALPRDEARAAFASVVAAYHNGITQYSDK